MKIKKLFDKAEAFLNAGTRKRKEKKKCLRHVLKKLRKHEAQLNAQLKSETDKKNADKICKEISLVHAQRKKGLGLLKKLKQENKPGKK